MNQVIMLGGAAANAQHDDDDRPKNLAINLGVECLPQIHFLDLRWSARPRCKREPRRVPLIPRRGSVVPLAVQLEGPRVQRSRLASVPAKKSPPRRGQQSEIDATQA